MPTLEERIAAMKADLAKAVPPSIAADQQMQARQRQNATSMGAFGHAAANRYFGNIANIPDVVGNLAARSVNQAADAMPDFMRPSSYAAPTGDVRQFEQRNPMIPVPQVGQEFVPGPTASDLMGLAQRGGELAGAIRTGDFNQFRPDAAAQQQARTEAFAEQNPVATALGNISGDVLTLITGRQPIAAGRGRANLLADVMSKRAASTAKPIQVAPTVSAALKTVTSQSKGARTLLNRLGRAGETGLEGFTIAALNGQADPVETMAYAAGTQAAGSLLLSGMGGLFSGGVGKVGLKLGASAVAMGAITELLRSGTFGTDDPVGSLATGFDKVLLGLAAGTVSAAAGMGRVTKGFPVRAIPDFADVITSMPRAATLSVLTSIQEDPAAEAVVNKMASNPEYFSPAELRRLERPFKDANYSLSGVIDGLMKDREFQKKFEAIGQ